MTASGNLKTDRIQSLSVNVFPSKVNLRPFLTLTFVWAIGVVIMLTLGSIRLQGQLNTATLNGTVTDPSGAAVPGAKVTVANTDTGVSREIVTNDSGAYSLPSLSPGKYSVTVARTGFSNAKKSGLTLEVAQVATVNIVLALGNDTQTVEVTTTTAFLDSTDASLGTVIPEQQVTDLPLNGRQFSQLLQLSPGTVPIDISQNAGKAPNYGGGGSSPAVDGQPNRSNIFFLDGIIASNPFFGGFSFSPSVDAIQEFKAQSHTDQAEFGQATGAVVSVVSRPGTNSVHGSVFEFVRNQIFDAQNAFDSDKLPYHLNQFGASVGGPILKNKLFVFGNYEGGRQVIQPSANFSNVPTEAERGGDFSGPLPGGITRTIYDPATYDPETNTIQPFAGNVIPKDRIDAGMLAYLNGVYPHANYTPNAVHPNNFLATTKNTTFGDQGQLRVDYAIGPKDSLNGHYAQHQASLSSPSSLSNLFVTGFDGKSTGGTWTHIYSPSLISDITAGYNNLNIPQGILVAADQDAVFSDAGLGAGFNKNPGLTPVTLIPGFGLGGGNYTGFWNGAGPIGPMHIIQVGGTVSKTAGTHSLKFGASYYKTWMYTNWNGNNEDFSYKATWNPACQLAEPTTGQCSTKGNPNEGDQGAGGDPVASMLLSLPIDATRNLGNSGVNLRENTPAIFAQDSWKVTPKLTVTYGMRWDFAGPMTERDNRLATYNFYTQQYSIVQGDKDLPSGALPSNVTILNRHSIVNSDYLDFSPRFGLAYQLTPKTTVRLGAGRTFDNWGLPLQVGQQNRGAWPSGLVQQASQQQLNTSGISVKPDGSVVTGQNPFYGEPVLGASPLPAGGLGFQDTRWVPASSFQWNAEVQRELGGFGSLSLAYVGSHTQHQTILLPYNLAQPSAVRPANLNFPDKVFGGTGTTLTSGGNSNYQSFQAKLTKAYSRGLAYNASFTYSQTRALSSCGDFSTVCIQDITNPQGSYGRAALDVPLIFTFNATYQLPFGRGRQYLQSGPAAVILGNWQINTLFATRSGTVINPTNGQNGDNANTGGGAQRINFKSDPEKGAKHTRTSWWNPDAFGYPDPGTFGNAGINSLRGPGYWSDDLSLFRDIPFNERMKLQFRVEAFDVFNHPNLGNPNFNQSSGSSFNTISSTVSTTGPGANRTVQFAAKFLF